MTEDPRGRGFPDLGKPDTRVSQAWRHMWQRMLIETPNKVHTANRLIRATRAATRRH